MPKAPVPAAPPNDFTSLEQRNAALRARGLVPAAAATAVPRRFRDLNGYMMPLSEQEAEIDRRFTIVVPGDASGDGESESEARRIKEAWLAKQGLGGAPDELSESECGSSAMENADGRGSAEFELEKHENEAPLSSPPPPPVPRKSGID